MLLDAVNGLKSAMLASIAAANFLSVPLFAQSPTREGPAAERSNSNHPVVGDLSWSTHTIANLEITESSGTGVI